MSRLQFMDKVGTPPAHNKPDQTMLLQEIAAYWNVHIHDLEIATQPMGSKAFFDELDTYRFDKLRYLPRVVKFDGYRGQSLLEIGCGAGIDLVRFALGEANVTGIDLAPTSIELAQTNFDQRGLQAALHVMNGEAMRFADNSFDVVYMHGVLQYTADPAQMISEACRVLRPGGQLILMVYNKYSWLNALSKIMGVELEHEDAPMLKKFSIREVRSLLQPFTHVAIIPERFPVESKLHKGLKAMLYNKFFVTTFNLLPRSLVRFSGWHIMAFATKK
jgi:ubiquinone/menaquinone biosynthesis C-methylase UbiE